MRETRYATFAAGALLLAIDACSATGAGEQSNGRPDDPEGDGGSLISDAGPLEDDVFDFDAERPLVCGDAGFCETRLPKSDHGTPLSLRSIWAVSSDDVWSVTAEGYILHYDGMKWTTEHRTGHLLSTVWATSAGAWAGGEGGLVLHKPAGGAWTSVETDRTSTIRAISGTSDEDVWFAREDGLVDHFDGAKLTAYPVDIPGIRITAVVGRPGMEMYLAGYVPGPPPPPGSNVIADEPYILTATRTGTSLFNSASREHKGFIPVSIGLTGSPDESQAMFVLGYIHEMHFLRVVHGTFGSTNELDLHPVTIPAMGGSVGVDDLIILDTRTDPLKPFQVWVHRWDDVVMPYSSDFAYWYLLRWDGNAETHRSLTMGSHVAPRTIQGVHGNSSDMWLVGDGFALKGATP